MTGSNRQVISVSELNRNAKRLLESEFPMLYVEGEISNFSRPASGHWYFTLKDDNAQLRCAMFRNRNQKVQFRPEDGQQIIVRGSISLYEGRGEFQMLAESLEDAGDGALRQAYEKLKTALQAEGLFSGTAKKPVPKLSQHLAIITSPTGAAVRDVLTVMGRRFPAMRASILPVQVQGENSVQQIVEAIAWANQYQKEPFDLILLTRGGGSLEDLWSFNTEPVARAIAASELPIVCAVGHESDVSIADFVADLRAPTPSAAAELITPDVEVWLHNIRNIKQGMIQTTAALIAQQSREIHHLYRRFRHPAKRLESLQQRLDELERRLVNQSTRHLGGYSFEESHRRLVAAVNHRLARYHVSLARLRLVSPSAVIASRSNRLQQLREKLIAGESLLRASSRARFTGLAEKLQTLSPLATLQRGYAIISSTDSHQVITHANDLHPGDKITARLMRGHLLATVDDTFDQNPGQPRQDDE